MKKIFLSLSIMALAASSSFAEELTVTHSATDGFATELSEALSAAGITAADVTTLKITGNAVMSYKDFAPIRSQMSATLEVIDMSETVFKENSFPTGNNYGKDKGSLMKMAALTKAILPEGLKAIGGGAFYNCPKLQDVVIPNTVTTVYDSAFELCKELAITSLPASLKIVRPAAFDGCSKMQIAELPVNLTEVYNQGFRNCKGITASVMPSSLKTIREDGFRGTSVSFAEWSESIATVSSAAFNTTNVTFTTWPENIAEIPNGVLGNCKGITDFTIPATISSLKASSFYIGDKTILRTFTCRNMTPPTADMGEWPTFGTKEVWKNITMKVLKDAVESYQATAPYSSMTVEALTTSIPAEIEGDGTISSELGELENGLLPAYEGNTEITITPGDNMTLSSATYDGVELEVVDGKATINCPQNPAALKVVFSTMSSVNEIGSESIRIYPNPASSIVNISNYDGSIDVYDLAGALVARGNGNKINISYLENGVYILKTANKTHKIVKQ